MRAMLLSIAMLFQEWGAEPQSFPVPVLLFLLNLLSLSKIGTVSYARGSFLLFGVPNWKALSETLSSRAESRENDPQRSALVVRLPELLDETRHSYPYLPLSLRLDYSVARAASRPLPSFFPHRLREHPCPQDRTGWYHSDALFGGQIHRSPRSVVWGAWPAH